MNHLKLSLGLLLGVLILGGLATYDDWLTKKEEKEKETKDKVFSFDRATVTELVFESISGGDTPGAPPKGSTEQVVLKRVDDKWTITSPVAAPADDATVTTLLQTIDDFKFEKKFVAKKDQLKQYGLDPASRSVTLKMAGKTPEQFTVSLGDKANVGYSVYVTSTLSDDVYAGNQYFLTATNKTLKDFRKKEIIKVDVAEVAELNLKNSKSESFKLSRKDDGDIQVLSPISASGDKDVFDTFFSDLSSLRAEDFKDNPSAVDVKAFKGAKVKFAVSIKKKDAAEVSFTVAEIEKAFWLSFDESKLWYKIPEASKQKIDKSIDDWRSKRIFNFKSDELVQLNVDGESYNKKNNDWYSESNPSEAKTFLAPAGSDLEFLKADKFLALSSNEAKDILKSPPSRRVVLGLKKAEATDTKKLTLDLWEDKNDKAKLYLRASESVHGPMLFRVNESIFANLKPPSGTATLEPSKNGNG